MVEIKRLSFQHNGRNFEIVVYQQGFDLLFKPFVDGEGFGHSVDTNIENASDARVYGINLEEEIVDFFKNELIRIDDEFHGKG